MARGRTVPCGASKRRLLPGFELRDRAAMGEILGAALLGADGSKVGLRIDGQIFFPAGPMPFEGIHSYFHHRRPW